MKPYKTLATIFSSLAFCAYAHAAPIYENGMLNGTDQGASIVAPQSISDSFILSAQSTLTSATAGLWVLERSSTGGVPVSLTWSIGSAPFGTELGSGIASLSNTLVYDYPNDADVFLSTFNLGDLGITLDAGTYYLTLGNGMSSNGELLSWDINQGPSDAFYMNGPDDTGSAPSEYFRLDGTVVAPPGPSPVPEPASLAILAGGLIALGASRRRRAQ